ncbi:MAG: hypothetical protein QMD14_03495 [Candidatus Aenigmarchaeota archaeon]|nr:hypothetical protein [Candidatus Aenigmarchaeota archaeon]
MFPEIRDVMLCERREWGKFLSGYHEPKLDGMRTLLYKWDEIKIIGRDQTKSRDQMCIDITRNFPEIVEELKSYPLNYFIFDAEVLHPEGLEVARGRRLLEDKFRITLRASHSPCEAYVLDVIFLEKEDVRDKPLYLRKEKHDQLPETRLIKKIKQYPLEFLVQLVEDKINLPPELARITKAIEKGLVEKDPESPYICKRTHYWRKYKLRKEEYSPIIRIELRPNEEIKSFVVKWDDKEIITDYGLSDRERILYVRAIEKNSEKVGNSLYPKAPLYGKFSFEQGQLIFRHDLKFSQIK